MSKTINIKPNTEENMDETKFSRDIFEPENENTKKTVKNELTENPCYHCYAGASGQCYMTTCKHQFKEWAKDVESEYIKK